MSDDSANTPESSSAASASAAKRPHEATRKARVFDVDAMFAQAISTAPTYKHDDGKDPSNYNAEDAVKGLQKVSIPRAGAQESGDSGVPTEEDDDDFGPALPPGFIPDASAFDSEKSKAEKKSGGNQDDEEGDEEDELSVAQLIPAACEAMIRMQKDSPISAMDVDHPGSKFALGNFAYFVNIYDYMKMDSSMQPYRELQPSECHVINDLSFSNNGEKLLVASGEALVKIVLRSGEIWCETVRGDQYLVDVALTKGHTASVNCCCWHPFSKTEFLTCSEDGTLRIWNTDDYKEITKCINTQQSVIRTKNAAGKRIAPRVCCYSRDGKWIAAGCDDGSLHVWKYGKVYVSPRYVNRTAHAGAVTGMQFSADSKGIVTRAKDGTLKVFNLDSFKKPTLETSGLDNSFDRTDVAYSPHMEFIYTGTSTQTEKEQYKGDLLFFSAQNLDLLYKIEFPTAGVIRVKWQAKINQIFVTLTDGTCRNYYDPQASIRGALLCATKPVRRARTREIIKEEMIISPLALEMFQARGEDGEEKEVTEWRIKKYLKLQALASRPAFRTPAQMPLAGGSAGGRVAQSGGSLHSYIAQQLGTARNREFLADEDIRSSILRHAEETEKNPMYISKAYAKTQPVPIFQSKTTDDAEEDDDDEPVFKAKRLG